MPLKIVFSDRFNLNRHPPTLPVKNKTFPLLSRRRLRLCVSTFTRCYPSIEPRPNARAESLGKKKKLHVLPKYNYSLLSPKVINLIKNFNSIRAAEVFFADTVVNGVHDQT